MQVRGHDVGVCSWSLRPADTADLVAQVKSLGLSHVQLAVAPLIMLDDKRKHFELGQLRASGLKLTGTMMNYPGEDYATIDRIRQTGGYLPDADWPLRKRLTESAARLTAELGATSLTSHVGFVPHKGKPGYDVMLGRVREIAGLLGSHGVTLIMETGQEPAAELVAFFHDLAVPHVAINFDPANMILYGAGDPIEAIGVLAKYVRHVHVKDATASENPGTDWGDEVPFGTGQVNPRAFLDALDKAAYTGPLAIEREAGELRAQDVRTAIKTLQSAA